MSKADAIFELAYEAAELKDRLFLADADKDLHRVYCEAQGVEVTLSLHGGYPQRLPREKAFMMLDSEINRIVAAQVTRDIIDDILEWMREGWHFGETHSRVAAAGNLAQLKHQQRGSCRHQDEGGLQRAHGDVPDGQPLPVRPENREQQRGDPDD